MPKFIMLIGLPAAGKDTWAENELRNHPNTVIHSSDAIREEMYGDESIQGNPVDIFVEMRRRALQSLKEGKNVIYNATNITYKDRRGILTLVKNNYPSVSIEAVVLATPIEECKRRNALRDRKVPDYVYDRMLRRWQTPFENEGFDSIIVIYCGGHTERRLAYAKQVRDFGDQKNPHHSLTLDEHCDKCGRLVFEQPNSYSDLSIAGSIHDWGKVFTQSFDEDGVAHYYSHENVGGYLALEMGFNLKVAQLVNYHMLAYNKQSVPTWRARLGEGLWEEIELLHKADMEAH